MKSKTAKWTFYNFRRYYKFNFMRDGVKQCWKKLLNFNKTAFLKHKKHRRQYSLNQSKSSFSTAIAKIAAMDINSFQFHLRLTMHIYSHILFNRLISLIVFRRFPTNFMIILPKGEQFRFGSIASSFIHIAMHTHNFHSTFSN